MAVSGRRDPKKFPSTLSMSSEEDVQLVCQPCDRNGPRRAAKGYCTDCEDHLCQSCFDSHRSVKPCRNHVLLNQNAMPKSQRLSSMSVDTSHSNDLTKPCARHTKKMLEFFCHDHEELLCSVCVTLQHTQSSCRVNYIPDISGQIVNSREYTDTIQNINDLLKQCQSIKTEAKKTTEKSDSSFMNVLKEIKLHRQEINRRLDELEKEVEDKAKALQQENKRRLETAESTCDDIHKSTKLTYDTVTQLNSSKQADKLFLQLKTAQKEIEEKIICIDNLVRSSNIKEYNFGPNTNISTFLQNELTLGMLETRLVVKLEQPQQATSTTPPDTKQTSLPATSDQPIHQGDICVKTTVDKSTCCITGMTLLTPDQLVLADKDNNSVKMVDIKRKHVASQIILPSVTWNITSVTSASQIILPCSPWDITSVTSTELAVTLPHEQTIQFISFSSNRLTQTHSLEVDGDCLGIHCYQQKLVVTYIQPKKLEVLDMKGRILTTVRTNSSGENIFPIPRYVTANSSFIYVSNLVLGASSVIGLNWKGEVTGSFKGAEWSEDLTLTKAGTVFVCDKNSNNIQEISADCSKGKVVLNSVKRPQSVCWCEETRILYISSGSGTENEKTNNFLKVYKVP